MNLKSYKNGTPLEKQIQNINNSNGKIYIIISFFPGNWNENDSYLFHFSFFWWRDFLIVLISWIMIKGKEFFLLKMVHHGTFGFKKTHSHIKISNLFKTYLCDKFARALGRIQPCVMCMYRNLMGPVYYFNFKSCKKMYSNFPKIE